MPTRTILTALLSPVVGSIDRRDIASAYRSMRGDARGRALAVQFQYSSASSGRVRRSTTRVNSSTTAATTTNAIGFLRIAADSSTATVIGIRRLDVRAAYRGVRKGGSSEPPVGGIGHSGRTTSSQAVHVANIVGQSPFR